MEKLAKTMRVTNQRQVILEELRKITSHPTAGEMYDLVRQRLPRIGLGTVYRNLELLANHGVIQKLEVSGEQKRFDGEANPHYHIRCSGCGRIDDLHIAGLPDLDKKAARCCDYQVLGHHIEFNGICAECRASLQT